MDFFFLFVPDARNCCFTSTSVYLRRAMTLWPLSFAEVSVAWVNHCGAARRQEGNGAQASLLCAKRCLPGHFPSQRPFELKLLSCVRVNRCEAARLQAGNRAQASKLYIMYSTKHKQSMFSLRICLVGPGHSSLRSGCDLEAVRDSLHTLHPIARLPFDLGLFLCLRLHRCLRLHGSTFPLAHAMNFCSKYVHAISRSCI